MQQNAKRNDISGILPVYKERGFTSFDVVAKLRGILKTRKIGHTGTLDPDAEGVLVVCIGSATRLVEILTDRSKEYEAEMIFGMTTDTQDISGTVLNRGSVDFREGDAADAILSFAGEYDQIPPMYSALKHNGKKLYELAREGKIVDRKPRRVRIYDLEILKINLSGNRPAASVRVCCSKGTYIRTLINDIGEKLGCGACMSSLLRTKAAGFSLNECLSLDEIESLAGSGNVYDIIRPVERVFDPLPGLSVVPEADKRLYNGNRLRIDDFEQKETGSDMLKVYDSNGLFKAVYEADGGEYKVRFIF